MANEDTSAYWRKLLKLDEEEKEDILKQFEYPHRFLRPLLYLIFGLFSRTYFKLRAFGVENVPEKPPYIIAPNHVSAADYHCVAFSLPKEIKKNLYVLVTKVFYDNPFTGFFIKVGANAARIDTVEDFFPAMRVAASILKLGKAVYINPEGTRSETGKLMPFKVGVGVLAVELGVPIVPVYVDGTFELLPTGSVFPKPGKVNVFFGKPISMEEYQEKKKTESAYYVYKEVTEELRKRILELREKAQELRK